MARGIIIAKKEPFPSGEQGQGERACGAPASPPAHRIRLVPFCTADLHFSLYRCSSSPVTQLLRIDDQNQKQKPESGSLRLPARVAARSSAPLRQSPAARSPVSAEPLRVSGHAARV